MRLSLFPSLTPRALSPLEPRHPGVCLFDAFSLSISLSPALLHFLISRMSRVYKLYLSTYLPRPSDSARRLFFEPEATRESPDRSCHPTPPSRPSVLLPNRPPASLLPAASPPSQPRNTPPTLCTTLLERACGVPPRVSVRACLTIRVFVSAMNVLSPTVNRAAPERNRKWKRNRKREKE